MQLVWGARISLFIGFSVGFLSTLIGIDDRNDRRVYPRSGRWGVEYVHQCFSADTRFATA